MNRFYWSGISNDDRIKTISEVTNIVNRYATILNFQRFSDISLNLILEIKGSKINELQMNLKNIMALDGADTKSPVSDVDCLVLFNITFTKGTGDLEIEVPNIPE